LYPDPDPGGPQTYGSCGSGSATLVVTLQVSVGKQSAVHKGAYSGKLSGERIPGTERAGETGCGVQLA